GSEWPAESAEARKLIAFLQGELGVRKIRFPATSGIGVKPVSREGTERLARAAIDYALRRKRRSVTFVHKGNIMKYTEGAFRDWGYALAVRDYRDRIVTERESWILGNREARPSISVEDNAREIDPGYDLMTPDQQAKVRRDVEATHGTAPKYANQDKVNPGSVILSGEMMFRHLGWDEAADAIMRGMEGAIAAKTVTYDFHRLMEGATLVKCSEFGRAIIAHM